MLSRTIAGLVLFVAGSLQHSVAQEWNLASLHRLLQASPIREVRFSELRESQWLTGPVESTGTLTAGEAMLEKRVLQPRRETWRILKDRMQLVTGDSGTVKEFMFEKVPAMAALATALRRIVGGDLHALEQDFRVALGGTQAHWTVTLDPRRREVAQYLKQLELQGDAGRLRQIVIVESQGDRTSLRLIHEP